MLEEDSISKSENKNVVNDKKSFDELKSSNRIPYHRTSGARFCPNGNILGKQHNIFLLPEPTNILNYYAIIFKEIFI